MTYLVITKTEAKIDLGQEIHNFIWGTTNKKSSENIKYDNFLNTRTYEHSAYMNKPLLDSARNVIVVNNIESKELPVTNSTDIEHLSKRSEAYASWECESSVRWRDLGSLHYPRFVKEVVCVAETSACFNGFYSCIPSFYPISVLTAKNTRQHYDMTLPFQLRLHWQFITINISVGCLCG
ncbi:hypothetical protein DPMN_111914 [Dreissena polymorpha]|uniref:Uncharacterized protein n=1 Tax=Dreissena polymorpha TaxID=45954 RepID=A0A9D4KFJ1_DREPO|nr:hypothetical protein DPMN_111914 [Dreissena polymorpha]